MLLYWCFIVSSINESFPTYIERWSYFVFHEESLPHLNICKRVRMGSFSTRLKSKSFAFTWKALLLLIGTHCRVSLLSTGRLNTCEFFLFEKMLSGLVLIIYFFFREKGFTLLLKPTMSNGKCYRNETVLTIDFIMLYFNLLVAPFHGNRITWGKIRKQEKKILDRFEISAVANGVHFNSNYRIRFISDARFSNSHRMISEWR